MPSWTAIANRALGALNEHRIQTYTSTTEKGAIEFRNVYEMVRDEVLASHPWNCAMRRLALEVSATAPTWGFSYAYPLPSDPQVLRVWKLNEDRHGNAPFKVIEGEVHTDEGTPLHVECIVRVTDPMDFTPLLAKTIAAYIAEAIAMPMTDSEARRDKMNKWAEECLAEARFADGQEGTPDDVIASEFEDARW